MSRRNSQWTTDIQESTNPVSGQRVMEVKNETTSPGQSICIPLDEGLGTMMEWFGLFALAYPEHLKRHPSYPEFVARIDGLKEKH